MCIGFFDIDKLPKATFDGVASKQPTRTSSCTTCNQYQKCKSPQLPAIGLGEKRILIITGNVTRAEETSNNERHSTNYSYLKKHLKECGIDMEKDLGYLLFILIDNPGGIVDRIDPALEYLVRDDFPTPFIMRSMGSPSSQSIV